MREKITAREVRAEQFVLTNPDGDIIATLGATGIGTSQFTMHNCSGIAIELVIGPDGCPGIFLRKDRQSIQLGLNTTREGGLQIGITKPDQAEPLAHLIFMPDGSTSINLPG